MFWLARLNAMMQRLGASTCGANQRRSDEFVQLWVDRLEDRRVLDAAAALVAGELLITGDGGGILDDDVRLLVTDDGTGGQLLQILDHGAPVAIDLGMGNTASQISLAELTSGRIQFQLGSGDDQLHLQIPAAHELPNGLELIVIDGAGDDTTTFESSVSGLNSSDTQLVVSAEHLRFATGFGAQLEDVSFELTGGVELEHDLVLHTGGGDFVLHGAVQSAHNNSLELELAGGDFRVDGNLGDEGSALGHVLIDAGSGTLELAAVYATDDVRLTADRIDLHGDALLGQDLVFNGEVFVHEALRFEATGEIDFSAAPLRPVVDALDLTFVADSDIQLGEVLEADPGSGAFQFRHLDLHTGADVSLQQIQLAGLLSIDNAAGTAMFATTVNAGAVIVAGSAELGGDVSTTGEQSYGSLLLAADVLLTAESLLVLGDINSELAAQHTLHVVATDSVQFLGDTGHLAGGELGGLKFASPAVLELVGTVRSAGDVELSGTAITILSSVETLAGGNVVLTNTGRLTLGNAADFQLTGSLQQVGLGEVWLGAEIATQDQSVTFTGPVTLTETVSITTGTSGGAITFLDTLNGRTPAGQSLRLDAGMAGDILFAGHVGELMALGAVEVLNARQVLLAADFTAAQLTQHAGTGTTELAGHVTLLNAAGLAISTRFIKVGGTVETLAGGIVLEALEDISVAGTLGSSDGSVRLAANNDLLLLGAALMQSVSGHITLIADADAGCDGTSGALTMSAGALIQSASGSITLSADESITLGSVQSDRALHDAISITSKHGALLDGGDSRVNLVANQPGAVVTLMAATGIGAGDALETQIAAVHAVVSGTGVLELNEVDDLLVLQGRTATGDIVLDVGGNLQASVDSIAPTNGVGTLAITTGGDLDVGTLGNALVLSGGDRVQLHAGGTLILPDAGIDVGPGVLSLQGTQDLVDATGRELGLLVAADLNFVSGSQGGDTVLNTNVETLTLLMNSAPVGTAISIYEQDGLNVNRLETNSGDVHIEAALMSAGDLTVTHIHAAGGDVTLSTVGQGGQIVDGGETELDIVGQRLTLIASAGIGSANALETQVRALELHNLSQGDVRLVEQDDVDVLQALQQGAGELNLTARGTLTVLPSLAVAPNVATTIGPLQLTALGLTGRLIIAGQLASADGAITLTAEENLEVTPLGDIQSSTGSVTLHAGGSTFMAGQVQSDSNFVEISAQNELEVSETGIVATGSGPIRLATFEGNVELAGTINSLTGSITATAGDDLLQSSTGRIQTTADISLESSGDTVLAGIVSATAGATFVTAQGDLSVDVTGEVASNNGPLTLRSGGNTFLDGSVSSGEGPVDIAAQGNLTLSATGTLATQASDILLTTVAGDVVVNGAVQSTSGQVVVNSGQDLLQGIVGVIESQAAITLHAERHAEFAGTVSTTGGSLVVMAGDEVRITATGVLSTDDGFVLIAALAGDVSNAGQVRSQTGTLEVHAGSDMQMAATARLETANSIDVQAVAALIMQDGAVIESTGSEVRLLAGGDVVVGQVLALPLIGITSRSGAIHDGGDTAGADLQAAALVLRAATGIGSGNALETHTSILAAVNSTSGSLEVSNDSGDYELLTLGEVDGVAGIRNTGSGEGDIRLSNAGSLHVTRLVEDLHGGGISLTAEGLESDIIVDAAVYAAVQGGVVQLTAERDLILHDTGAADDVRGQQVLGTAGRDVLFDEFSGVTVRSATGSVVSPSPRLENLQTPQIGANGISEITVEYGHAGSSNFYFVVLWDPAFIDRLGTAPGSFDGVPIFSLNNSTLPPSASPQNLPPEFEALLQVLIARQLEIGTGVSFDGYDPVALSELGTAAYTGESLLMAAHFYGANPDKTDPYNPAADIPIAVHLWDDGNITFTAAGKDLGQADVAGKAGVPGDGLQGGVFVFDLSIEVPPLEAPRVIVSDTATSSEAATTQVNSVEEVQVTVEAEVIQEEQLLIIERIKPDGTVARLPNGTLLRREIMGEEVQATLSDLPDLFDRLQEGHWRIYLQQGADGQPQLLRDVELRAGKPAGDDAGTQDRPPTAEANQ